MSQHGCPERLSNRSKGYPEEGPSQPTMEVLVETLTGTAFEMTVSPSDTVFAIKSKIFRVEGIPVSQQHLLYNLKELDDASSLRDLSITDGARLKLVLGLRGGPISTRRLPPPPSVDAPWRDIERLLDTNREEPGWVGKVTVLVLRDGERVSMLRVKENDDGTYSPIDLNKYSSSLKSLVEDGGDDGLSFVEENAVTMGKMMELRRRMESLCLRRATRTSAEEKPEAVIQKTRSEETLSVPSLLDEPDYKSRNYTFIEEDNFAPLYDGDYIRYSYDCSFNDRYTLLPPIGTRTDSEQSVQESIASEGDRMKLSEALSGSILVKSGVLEREESAGILEESVGVGVEGAAAAAAVDQCLAQDTAQPLAHVPTNDYGPLVVGSGSGGGGGGGGWRARGFGSSGALAAAGTAPRLHLLSSSTSALETLSRGRVLPALSRHRNTSRLHLSDDALLPIEVKKKPDRPAENKKRCGFCRRRLSIATQHVCRCGGFYCAPHRYAEVHGCAFDYKASKVTEYPRVTRTKLPEI